MMDINELYSYFNGLEVKLSILIKLLNRYNFKNIYREKFFD